ncbi:N-acetylmuramic acid 6-phosphate etherase [Treponema sp. OttesenSCG-928-L16]|nr:N-acetylmuramic acid 6-phosphate etherase [Treponema sp. OttesenSCG-928-L16]
MTELTTERTNPKSIGIDTKETEEILSIINSEDKTVPLAVETAIPEIAALVDDIVAAFRRGGRLFYIGAGTSGRLGVLDASECPPTYGVPPSMVRGLIAGGKTALTSSVEWAEDDERAGMEALEQEGFAPPDVLVGITASGSAPFVKAAMARAKKMGAVVGAIACNDESPIFEHADHRIYLPVGPEIIAGSTRMKAGTAQKLVLNMLTTASMIRLGKVYDNYMVDMTPVNSKLVRRAKRLIMKITGCSETQAEEALPASGNNVKTAIMMIKLAVSKEEALRRLEKAEGNLHKALEG